MLILELMNTNAELRIFCDLDGVLVNFIKTAVAITGINPDGADKKTVNAFWSAIHKHTAAGQPFFAEMEPMPDANVLWSYINRHNPVILSSTGERIVGAADEKRKWVQQHLGGQPASRAIFTPSAKAKAQHAAPNHVLIDDRAKAIDPWVAAGGIGILHTSAANTITRLKELGL